MSIRKMKLKDYGITPGRAAELKEMVKDKQYYSLVIEACIAKGKMPERNHRGIMGRRNRQRICIFKGGGELWEVR